MTGTKTLLTIGAIVEGLKHSFKTYKIDNDFAFKVISYINEFEPELKFEAHYNIENGKTKLAPIY